MVLFRPLRLLQRLDKPLSVLVHKVCLCSKIDRGSSSLCSSLRGLSSTIQLRIDSSQPAQACPWKFHNAAHTNVYHQVDRLRSFTQIYLRLLCQIFATQTRSSFIGILCSAQFDCFGYELWHPLSCHTIICTNILLLFGLKFKPTRQW